MDIVEPLNHLIPSDQLEDSLPIGQNLECEASNEFGTGIHLEESLKNMLSDKDPMFGSESSQFNLLDNDPNFQAAGSTGEGLDGGTTPSQHSGAGSELACAVPAQGKRQVGRPRKYPRNTDHVNKNDQVTTNLSVKHRGRPGRKPTHRQLKSFLIEKGVQGPKLKKELAQGGRINIHNLDVGLWLNPVVVLRRLTVTVGGFRIELLPGPSYAQNTAPETSESIEESVSHSGDNDCPMLQDEPVTVDCPVLQEEPVTVDCPVLQEEPVTVDCPVLQEEPVTVDCPVLQDEPVSVDCTVLQDEPVSVDCTVLQDEPVSVDCTVLQDEPVTEKNSTQEHLEDLGVHETCCAGDIPLTPGPYVNPNDVQAGNGTIVEEPCLAETKLDTQNVPEDCKPVSEEKDDIKDPQNIQNNKTDLDAKMESKEKQKTPAKKGLSSVKPKSFASGIPSRISKGPKIPKNMPSKPNSRGDTHNEKSIKEKASTVSLKRPGENVKTEHASKIQKMQDGGHTTPKPKLPVTFSPVKKTQSSGNSVGEQHGLNKQANSQTSVKSESSHSTHGTTGYSKILEEGAHEKHKIKKPEKIFQKLKSKNARSISVDEPQLFIPDNAPVVKKETIEEPPANSESIWDGINNCGLCKKNHNNTFMVGCGRCDDWFHGECVGLDLMKVREMEQEDQMYVCLKCCAEESTKMEPDVESVAKPEENVKHEVKDNKPPPKPGQGPSQSLSSSGAKPVKRDPDRRPSTGHTKQERKSKSSPTTAKKHVSVEEIRRSVRDSLKDILVQRLKDSDLNVTSEKASEVAKKTERELFHLYKDTDTKYKSKYRSLMFNLKDIKNNVLFKRVLKGEISPFNLIRMSPEELASKELAAWRQRENRHTIEMIEKEQREVERRPITKITHKGEIEIESQEPAKAPETVELEPSPNASEEIAVQPIKQISKGPKIEKDTTNLHKSHLFDLHCKICTGHMAPPVEEAPTKVVKVATTVARRQSTAVEESNNTPPIEPEDDIHFTVLEESFRNAQLSSVEGRSEFTSGRGEEAAFLSNLKSLWRGFINMPTVAKLVTRAFPVSGILDKLTEDLPDSIQVGGRIGPVTVWDYLEKIRATGTKEVCLIRFSPETEEDEISYTLLYAYFSSRKRFGVVSNNLKQVKDMYLIPLGATEKIPHQLVPFDGPGLENNRSNLLLGLIIRQRPKKDFLPVDMNEMTRIVPESKPVAPSSNDTRAAGKDEKLFLSSLKPVYIKEPDIQLKTTEETADEPITESYEEASATEEASSQESYKPLRFLPGVLVGWGGELPPLPDVGGKPPPAADDHQRTQPAPKIDAPTLGISTKSLTSVARLDRFIIKKKEPKLVKVEPEKSNPTDKSVANNSTRKDAIRTTGTTLVSLKDKPPDVLPETSVASLATPQSGTDTRSSTISSNQDDGLLSETEKGKPEGSIVSHSQSQAASENKMSPKPLLSGILKKSSAYFDVSQDKKTEEEPNKASHPVSLNPQPIPLLDSGDSDPTLASPQEQPQSHPSQAELKFGEVQINISEKEDPDTPVADPMADLPANPPTDQGQQAASCAPTQTEDSSSQYDSVVPPTVPTHSNAAPVTTQPQVPGSYSYLSDPTPNVLPTPDTQSQNNSASRAQDGPVLSPGPVSSPAPQVLFSQYLDSCSESPGRPPTVVKEYKRPEDRYSDPWDRPRHSHRSDTHHGKKNKHHDREHGSKHERTHEDKYRERSRHHGHSEDRYGERRKERHYSDDNSNRHKDRHRHRRL